LKPDVLQPDVLKPDVLWVYRFFWGGGEISTSEGSGEELHPFLTKTNPRKNQAFEFWKHI
jgi:hypothetical protein